MNPKIRPAKNGDLPGILSLLEGLSEIKSDPRKASEAFNEILRSKSYFLFVASLEKKVVGTSSIFIAPSLQHGQSWGLIDNVVVAKKFRRNGIGTELVNTLIDFGKKKGCYKIILTSRFNRPGIHKFWGKLGFRKHGFSFRMDL